MIIDAHNHPGWSGHNCTRFLANMRQTRIHVTWLLSWECPVDEYDPNYNAAFGHIDPFGPVPFSSCLSYAERAPGKFVLGFAPDPRRPDALDRLRAAIDIHGVRVYGELKLRMMYDNPDALRVFRFCGEKGLPVIMHFDYDMGSGAPYPRPNWWYGGGVDCLERVLKACPKTTFLGHAPGFWSHISGDNQYNRIAYPTGKVKPGGALIRLLRQYPNLYCDWSAGSGFNALNRDRPFAREFALEFQDRLLYARDSFGNGHQELLRKLRLPATVTRKILAGNALRLVPLSAKSKGTKR